MAELLLLPPPPPLHKLLLFPDHNTTRKIWGEGSDPSRCTVADRDRRGNMTLDYAVRLLRYTITMVSVYVLKVPPIEMWEDTEKLLYYELASNCFKRAYVLRKKAIAKRMQSYVGNLKGLGEWIYQNTFINPNKQVLKRMRVYMKYIAKYNFVYPSDANIGTIAAMQQLRANKNQRIRRKIW